MKLKLWRAEKRSASGFQVVVVGQRWKEIRIQRENYKSRCSARYKWPLLCKASNVKERWKCVGKSQSAPGK